VYSFPLLFVFLPSVFHRFSYAIYAHPIDGESPNLQHVRRRSPMPQAQLKRSYVTVTVFCDHCQQEQVVPLQARA